MVTIKKNTFISHARVYLAFYITFVSYQAVLAVSFLHTFLNVLYVLIKYCLMKISVF
jgi:hypothetical protein